MPPTDEAVKRLTQDLRLETPLVAVYDAAPSPEFEPLVRSSGRACCFAYYGRWVKGETLVMERGAGPAGEPVHGCPGGQNALGVGAGYPPYMAHFLTDGKGAPMGEGLKATPALAQEFLDRAKAPAPAGDTVLLGPLRPSAWDRVRSVSFFADPDRLSALLTLAAFRTSDPDLVAAPFSSGCGLLWRELLNQPRDRPVIGCTDIAMRRHLPPELLCLTVSPGRFEQMLSYPDDAFLRRSWWRELLESRKRR